MPISMLLMRAELPISMQINMPHAILEGEVFCLCFLPSYRRKKNAFNRHKVCHFSQKCSFRFLNKLLQWETKGPRAYFVLCFEQCHVMLLSCAPKASKLGWRGRQANVTHTATNISLSTSISFLLIKFVSSKLFLQVMF